MVFYFFMDDLTLNDMTLILSVDVNDVVLIETHVSYDKPFILIKKIKSKDHIIEIWNPRTKFKYDKNLWGK
jgi:predicted RNA-binding protein